MTRTKYGLLIFSLLLSGCTPLPDNSQRIESYAISDAHETTLGKNLLAYRDLGETQDGFIILDSGLDAFVARERP